MTDRSPSDPSPNPGKPAGISMLVISFVLGLGLLTYAFDGWIGRQQNPNQQPLTRIEGDVREITLQRNRQGHYLVSGQINGTRATFLLDTGATDVVLSDELSRQAGLQRGAAMQAMTANGVVTVYATSINELRVGDIVLENVRASINPAMSGDAVLLGMSALRHIEFSQRGDSLTLRYTP
jgi:aspartyl protease family protein